MRRRSGTRAAVAGALGLAVVGSATTGRSASSTLAPGDEVVFIQRIVVHLDLA